MQVGDLVMWTGKDEHHAMIGVITDIDHLQVQTTYDVMWADGTEGFDLYDCELMAVEDEEERQS